MRKTLKWGRILQILQSLISQKNRIALAIQRWDYGRTRKIQGDHVEDLERDWEFWEQVLQNVGGNGKRYQREIHTCRR